MDRVSKEELQDTLEQYEDSFEATVRRATDELMAADPSRKTHRLTLLWQMRILPMARDALDADDPLRGFLDIWTLAVRQRQYLEKGEGKALFGKHQATAVHAAREAESDIERIARLIMTDDQITAARKEVRELAARNPLRSEFSGGEVRATLQQEKQAPVLQAVLAVPLAPFRAFEGIDKGAAAIRGFTQVASRLTDVVRGLAADARLQLELLLLETENLETIRSANESFRKLAESSARLADAAEGLPNSFRESLDQVDAKQANLQKTLRDTLAAAEELQLASESVADAGRAWSGTAQSIQEMVASFRRPATSGPVDLATAPASTPPGRPFDITDYARTADSLTRAAVELQKVISDLREFDASRAFSSRLDDLDVRLDKVVVRSGETATEVVDRLVWRLGALVVAVLLLVMLYQRLVRRPREV